MEVWGRRRQLGVQGAVPPGRPSSGTPLRQATRAPCPPPRPPRSHSRCRPAALVGGCCAGPSSSRSGARLRARCWCSGSRATCRGRRMRWMRSAGPAWCCRTSGQLGGHLWRRRGRGVAAFRHAAVPAGGGRFGRGPAVLDPFRHRSMGHGARRDCRSVFRPAAPGRLHDYPAGGEEAIPDQCPHDAAQGAGTDADALAGAPFHQTEILEIWLNRVYLGSGAWGMDAARAVYFGISRA